jgi:hypothetical protein
VRRYLSASLLAALLFAGCGGTSETTSDVETGGTSNGQTSYNVASEGFAVAAPESWRAISVDQLTNNGELEAMFKETPALERYAEAFRGPNSPLKFFAMDPNIRNAFATNLNITVEELPAGMTLDGYEQASRSQLQTLTNIVGEFGSERVELPAGQALRLTYQLKLTASGRLRTASTLQYIFVGGGVAYVLTYTTLPEFASDYEDEFAESARSFRLT